MNSLSKASHCAMTSRSGWQLRRVRPGSGRTTVPGVAVAAGRRAGWPACAAIAPGLRAQRFVELLLLKLRRFQRRLGALAVAAGDLLALQPLPGIEGDLGERALPHQRQARVQQLGIAAQQPVDGRHPPRLVAVLGLRMHLLGVALAEFRQQHQRALQSAQPAALQPGLAEPGGEHQVPAAPLQQFAGQLLHRGPVGALGLRLPDAGRQAAVVLPAQLAQAVVVRVVAQAGAARLSGVDRFEQHFQGQGVAGKRQGHGVPPVLATVAGNSVANGDCGARTGSGWMDSGSCRPGSSTTGGGTSAPRFPGCKAHTPAVAGPAETPCSRRSAGAAGRSARASCATAPRSPGSSSRPRGRPPPGWPGAGRLPDAASRSSPSAA